jgi:hypothetical protein
MTDMKQLEVARRLASRKRQEKSSGIFWEKIS